MELDADQIKMIHIYLNYPIEANVRAHAILWDFIRHCKTQTNAAKRLNRKQQTLSYQLIHHQKIPLEEVLRMMHILRAEKIKHNPN